jgi:hypothetical protein
LALVNKHGQFLAISSNVARLRWIHLVEEALRE